MCAYRMPIGLFCIAVVLLLNHNQAAAINDSAGTTGFNFLKIGVGARAAALGGAYSAVPSAIESPAWNPAGLFGLSDRTATASLTRYLVDTQVGYVGLAVPGDHHVIGFSLNYFSYGDMIETDQDGIELGTFTASDIAGLLTFAQHFWNDHLVMGVNFKAVLSTIGDYSSDAYMIDVGAQLSGLVDGMTFGASLANVGTVRSSYSGDYKDSLPVMMRAGLSHRPAHTPLPMLIVADYILPNDNDAYWAFGAEIRVTSGFFLRPGYSLRHTGVGSGDEIGVTAGVGFEVQRCRIDYAYNSYEDLDDIHRISLTGTF